MSDKEKAMIKILKVLKSMMGVTVKSYREEALTLAFVSMGLLASMSLLR